MGHWYDRNGRPCHTIVGKNGRERETTLADARKLQLVPSVTTVLEILNKGALVDWKVRQGVLAALTLPRHANEDDEEFINRVVKDSRQQAKEAAEEGTRIHKAIEDSHKGILVAEDYMPHVRTVNFLLATTFRDVDDWVSEKSFSSHMGFGGSVDLHSPSTGIVVDFKTKDFGPEDNKKLAYDQHYQLAAYQRGLSLSRNKCANIFVSRTHPGHAEIVVWTNKQIHEGWQVFASALACWQAIKGYVPDFEGVA